MEGSCCSLAEVAPMQRAKMDSTPGRSGDSHPHRLLEEKREEYVLPCPALPQSLFAEQVAQQAQEDALQTGHIGLDKSWKTAFP